LTSEFTDRSRGQKTQANRSEYVELVRSIAQILDAIHKTLAGENGRNISTRVKKNLNDFKQCVHCPRWD
jgi:hypothetical protein